MNISMQMCKYTSEDLGQPIDPDSSISTCIPMVTLQYVSMR